jgi:leucyl-tRNA synthetase
VGFTEPFLKSVNQGMVLYQGDAMSKSKGNLVELGPTIERWGADATRVAVMFAGPPQDDMDWAAVSLAGIHKWLGRVWRAVYEAAAQRGGEGSAVGLDLRKIVHRTVKAVTADYERIGFNVAIAKMMTLTNELQRALDTGVDGEAAVEAAERLVLLLAPMAPHIAEELWHEALGRQGVASMQPWPSWDEDLAREDEAVLVVQVDGKVRDRLTVPADADEAACLAAAESSERVRRLLQDLPIVRTIVRPPRLVNFVTQ